MIEAAHSRLVVLNAPTARVGGAVTFTQALWPRLTERLEARDFEVVAISTPPRDSHERRTRQKLLRRSSHVLQAGNRASLGIRAKQVVCVRNRLLIDRDVDIERSARVRARQTLFLQGLLSADSLVVPTRAMVQPLQDFMRRWRIRSLPIRVIPHGRPDWRPEEARPLSSPLRLLYPSFVGMHKNLELLPQMLGLFAKRGMSVKLSLTAAKSDEVQGRSLRSWFADVENLVTFVGSVGRAELHDLYIDHDVLLFPSLSEAFGHPLLEAMTTNMPVVASDADWSREVCGSAALYAGINDPDSWVDAIEAIQRSARRDNPKAVEQVSRFDWDKSADAYVEALLGDA